MIFTGIEVNLWDLLLISVVSAQATLLAYLHRPKWKAFLLNLPLPFTIAVLSVGRPIDVTNITGLFLVIIYAHCVRLLNWRLQIPIVPAILISALLYGLLGAGLARMLPRTEIIFWGMSLLVMATAVFFHFRLPHREEPGHRSSLPVGIKLIAIAGIVTCLVISKKYLQGFMTTFPMVGLIAFYEARHSLWTICRQIPVIMLTGLAMMLAIRLAQPCLGYTWALIPGWLVFLAILIPITVFHWRNNDKQLAGGGCPRP